MANYETIGAKPDCWQHSAVKIPERVWFQVKWLFDGKNNSIKLWLNGDLVEELSVSGKGQGCVNNDLDGEWKFPVFENVLIEWVDYHSNGGERDMWIDDFVISKKTN